MEKNKSKILSLVEVGVALTSERDFSRILELILTKSMEISNSDAASIYLIEKTKKLTGSVPTLISHLRFLKTANRSGSFELQDRVLSLDRSSLAGFVAVEGVPLKISDAHKLPKGVSYSFEKKYDEIHLYRSKSMMIMPLKSPEGQILGVLQLINRAKNGYLWRKNESLTEADIVDYDDEDEILLSALASQAAVALNNLKLNQEIRNLFESFVKASVMAIESRDPTTSGHSDRVAKLAVETAKVVNLVEVGKFRTIKFTEKQVREIRYASLLHDFGKISVSEHVLNKENKLYPHELETLFYRMDAAQAKHHAAGWKGLCHELLHDVACSCPLHELELKKAKLEDQIQLFDSQFSLLKDHIKIANEPKVMAAEFNIKEMIQKIDKLSDQLGQSLLPEDVRMRLSIPKGSLSDQERSEIESHVTHTFRFLSEIAWTEELHFVPEIAHAHHEKLDGTGYPRKLLEDQIPVQAKIMTIADIYDALTARDRPYKKALDSERALAILDYEARNNKIDKELLRIFIEARIWHHIEDEKKKAA